MHINVSGAGVTAHAETSGGGTATARVAVVGNRTGRLAGLNMEYPVNKTVAPDPIVGAWGPGFKADDLNVNEAVACRRTPSD